MNSHLHKGKQSVAGQPSAEPLTETKFKHRLLAHFFVRFHMTLILSAVCMPGVVTSKLLLAVGISSMPVRYPIAVCVAYGVFFVLLRLWLWYIGISPRARHELTARKTSSRSGSIGDSISFDLGSGSSVRTSGSSSATDWQGFGGGSSGGAGATDSWGESAAGSEWLSAASPSPPTGGGALNWSGGSSGSSGNVSGSSLDFDLGDEGCLPVVVLLLLLALLVGIFGAGAYLIYQAPAIFAEAAFQAALASGLVKAARGLDTGGWKGSVWRVTWLPFVIVLALAFAFGWAAHRYCPAATKATEVFTVCKK